MDELKNIRDDIKNRRFIESYIVLAVGLVILVADVFGIANPSMISGIILATLSAIVYLTVLERREFRKLSEQGNIEGITAFYPNRDNLLPLDRIINTAKQEIILYAVQHSTVVHQYLGLLEAKAETGCKVKILLMAARSPDGKVNPNVAESESHRRYTGLLAQIEASTASFQTWHASLSPTARERVEIRVYLECPIATYTFIDRDEPDGFVQVELLLYGIHVSDVPHYIVSRKKGGRFFDTHRESFDRLWAKSGTLMPANQ